jgi:hypothetical protein
MKNRVVALTCARRSHLLRARRSAVSRFEIWQRSVRSRIGQPCAPDVHARLLNAPRR